MDKFFTVGTDQVYETRFCVYVDKDLFSTVEAGVGDEYAHGFSFFFDHFV